MMRFIRKKMQTNTETDEHAAKEYDNLKKKINGTK